MTFVLHLQSATQYERVDDAVSFVGEDATGSFGLLPGHARFMTVQVFGLARFRREKSGWEYLALPGAVVDFADDQLVLSTRRYLRGAEYSRMRLALQHELRTEEDRLGALKKSLQRLEREMLKHLWQMQRGTVS